MSRPPTDQQVEAAGRAIAEWSAAELAENPVVAAVETFEVDGAPTWFIRVHGEDKDMFTLRLVLRQRMLHHECQLMPAPEENAGELYEHLMRRNGGLHGLRLAIGEEDGIYIQGEVPVESLGPDVLDRILGSTYAAVEQFFRPAMRIGYARHFK